MSLMHVGKLLNIWPYFTLQFKGSLCNNRPWSLNKLYWTIGNEIITIEGNTLRSKKTSFSHFETNLFYSHHHTHGLGHKCPVLSARKKFV
jgi:hypothetical protein